MRWWNIFNFCTRPDRVKVGGIYCDIKVVIARSWKPINCFKKPFSKVLGFLLIAFILSAKRFTVGDLFIVFAVNKFFHALVSVLYCKKRYWSCWWPTIWISTKGVRVLEEVYVFESKILTEKGHNIARLNLRTVRLPKVIYDNEKFFSMQRISECRPEPLWGCYGTIAMNQSTQKLKLWIIFLLRWVSRKLLRFSTFWSDLISKKPQRVKLKNLFS